MTSKMHRLGVLLTLAMVITLVFVLTHATPALSQGTSTVGVSNLDEPAARHTSMVGYTGTFHDEASAVSFCNGYRNRINTSSYGFSVNENAGGNTVVGTLAACGDPHRASLTYSVGGTDAAAFNEAFELQTNKGEIAVKAGASIDYERGNRSYSLTATVTDADDSSEVTIPMSITVRNVDDPGTIRLSTTDPWVGRHVSFSLSPNPPKGACERRPEEAKGCTFESEIMVLNQKTCHRKGAPNRCYHVTTLTASKSPSTIPAW